MQGEVRDLLELETATILEIIFSIGIFVKISAKRAQEKERAIQAHQLPHMLWVVGETSMKSFISRKE